MVNSKNSLKYCNILDFCYDMDTLGFRKYAILPYLENYISRYNNFFGSRYFEKMDKNDICTAKQIIAECENISILIISPSTSSEVFEKKWEFTGKSHGIKVLNNDYPMKVEYDVISEGIYKILRNRSSELFQRVTIDHFSIVKNEMNTNFNDDINNSLNRNKVMFSKTINAVFEMIFRDNGMILKYDECKKVVKEISEENSIENRNIFEL